MGLGKVTKHFYICGYLTNKQILFQTIQVIALIASNGANGKAMKLSKGTTFKPVAAKSRYSYSAKKRNKIMAVSRTPGQTPGSPRPMSDTCERVLKRLSEIRNRKGVSTVTSANTTVEGEFKV